MTAAFKLLCLWSTSLCRICCKQNLDDKRNRSQLNNASLCPWDLLSQF